MVLKLMDFFRIAGRYEKIVPFIITFVAVLIGNIFSKEEILTLVIFVILILIFSIYIRSKNTHSLCYFIAGNYRCANNSEIGLLSKSDGSPELLAYIRWSHMSYNRLV
jgi:hypothetical protein